MQVINQINASHRPKNTSQRQEKYKSSNPKMKVIDPKNASSQEKKIQVKTKIHLLKKMDVVNQIHASHRSNNASQRTNKCKFPT